MNRDRLAASNDDRCEVCGISDVYYEAWFRVKDFAGIPTGLIQKMKCCKNCAEFSIAKEKEHVGK